MKFMLLPKTGTHVQTENGIDVEYEAGDIVESETDLAKNFPDKFQLIQDVDMNKVATSNILQHNHQYQPIIHKYNKYNKHQPKIHGTTNTTNIQTQIKYHQHHNLHMKILKNLWIYYLKK